MLIADYNYEDDIRVQREEAAEEAAEKATRKAVRETRLDAMRRMRKIGLSYKTIAEAYGISEKEVSKALAGK